MNDPILTAEPGRERERGRWAASPWRIHAAGWRDIASRVRREYETDHVGLTGAGVAFFAFTALAPLLVVAVSLFGLFASPARIGEMVAHARATMPVEVVNVLERQIASITAERSSGLGLAAGLGLLLALWSASTGMVNLMQAVNIAYEEDTDDRPLWRKRLVAMALTLGTIGLLVVSTIIVTTTASIDGAPGVVAQVAGWAIVGVLALFGLAVLYRFGPDRRDAEWIWVSPGSLLTVMAWVVASIGFRFLVGRFGSFNETYGALGAVVVLLLWLYLSSLLIIIGAEINAEIEHQTRRDTTAGPDLPIGERGAVVADTVGATHDRLDD